MGAVRKSYGNIGMSIFEKARHCTSRFPCRFKVVLILFTAAVVVSIVAVTVVKQFS